MTQPKAFHYSRAKFPPSRHLRKSDIAADVQSLLDRVEANANELADDANYTDSGRRAQFTSYVLPTVSRLNTLEAQRRTEARKIDRERAALRESARPRAATRDEREQLYEFARMARESKENRDYVMRILGKHDPSPDEYAIQLALCSVSPVLFGPDAAPLAAQYQTLIQTRLSAEIIGDQGAQLDEQAERIEDEIEAIRAARLSIVAAADRDRLHAADLIPKPVGNWSQDERRQFVHDHGMDAYQRVLYEEQQLGASPTTDRIAGIAFVDPDRAALEAKELADSANAAKAVGSALAGI